MNQAKWRNFIVGAMLHEGVKQEGNKYIVSISDLTFDLLKDTFPTKYQNVKGTDTRTYVTWVVMQSSFLKVMEALKEL